MERRSADRAFKRIVVGGIKTASVSRQQMGRLMVGDCLAARRGGRRPKLVFAANGHAVAMAATSTKFAKTFQAADIVHADGAPVVFASKMTEAPIPERSATTDFLHDAAAMAEAHGLKFFLLGATEEINDQPMEAMPLPKKATHMKAITISGASTKLAPTMQLDSSRPKMMGDLRAVPSITPLRSMRSDRKPASCTPKKAAMKGSET